MDNWEKHVRRTIPYVPGEQPRMRDVIKLNTNENPYPPSPGVLEALRGLEGEGLRRYPDPAAGELVRALSAHYHMPEEQIFVGVGSDDVLAMCFLTFFGGKEPVRFPDITYSFYDVWAQVFRIPYETVPLDDELRIRPEDYCGQSGGVVFPNPNAPTGRLLPLETVERIVSSNPDCVVIVDEAYIDFGGVSALPLVDRYENLLVVQTFSKSRSMAGMRIGYAFGSRKLIRYLNEVKYSFNSYTMNLPSIQAGAAAVRDEAYFQETTRKIMATRERIGPRLEQLGFHFPPSAANFLFVTHGSIPARELFEQLREARIFVRYFDRPRIDNYLRITIGTDEQMDTLLSFLERRVGAR